MLLMELKTTNQLPGSNVGGALGSRDCWTFEICKCALFLTTLH